MVQPIIGSYLDFFFFFGILLVELISLILCLPQSFIFPLGGFYFWILKISDCNQTLLKTSEMRGALSRDNFWSFSGRKPGFPLHWPLFSASRVMFWPCVTVLPLYFSHSLHRLFSVFLEFLPHGFSFLPFGYSHWTVHFVLGRFFPVFFLLLSFSLCCLSFIERNTPLS